MITVSGYEFNIYGWNGSFTLVYLRRWVIQNSPPTNFHLDIHGQINVSLSAFPKQNWLSFSVWLQLQIWRDLSKKKSLFPRPTIGGSSFGGFLDHWTGGLTDSFFFYSKYWVSRKKFRCSKIADQRLARGLDSWGLIPLRSTWPPDRYRSVPGPVQIIQINIFLCYQPNGVLSRHSERGPSRERRACRNSRQMPRFLFH